MHNISDIIFQQSDINFHLFLLVKT